MKNRRKVKNLVKKEAMKKKKKITKELEEIEAIAIISDVWTAIKQKRGYIGLTVHYFVDFDILVYTVHGESFVRDIFTVHYVRPKMGLVES